MKDFTRDNQFFSLCGLNCGLCPMSLDGRCPGCGGGEGNQSCAIARCSMRHSNVAYCAQCGEFPCRFYAAGDPYDSFVSHRNRRRDFEKAFHMGIEAYTTEQKIRTKILKYLLDHYNDGRRKTLFCFAANLFELEDLRAVVRQLVDDTTAVDISLKQRADYAAKLFRKAAAEKGIDLKPRRKPKPQQ